MTPLQHSDRILEAKPGAWLMACEPVSGVDMLAGGRVSYQPGKLFRVKHCTAGLVWVLDAQMRSVTFDRSDMQALEFCAR